MSTARIAQRIWPLTTGKLAALVWQGTIDRRALPDNHRVRRRLAIAYHAMRLYRTGR